MPGGWGRGSTRAWRRIRAQVLARDGYVCRIGLPGICVGTADCCHHVLGRSTTGDDPRWLQAACMPCNLAIGDPQRRRKKVIPVRRAIQARRAPSEYNRWLPSLRSVKNLVLSRTHKRTLGIGRVRGSWLRVICSVNNRWDTRYGRVRGSWLAAIWVLAGDVFAGQIVDRFIPGHVSLRVAKKPSPGRRGSFSCGCAS